MVAAVSKEIWTDWVGGGGGGGGGRPRTGGWTNS